MWPKISLKLKDFPPKKKLKDKKKKKKIRVRVKKTNLLDVALREIEPIRCGPNQYKIERFSFKKKKTIEKKKNQT